MGPEVRARQRAPFFDVHPQTGATIEVFSTGHWRCSAGAERWLVLVGPQARLFASRSGDRSVCYGLLSL